MCALAFYFVLFLFPCLQREKTNGPLVYHNIPTNKYFLLDWYLSRLHTRGCQYGATLSILQFILIRTPLENRRWRGQKCETKKAMIAPYYRTAQMPIALPWSKQQTTTNPAFCNARLTTPAVVPCPATQIDKDNDRQSALQHHRYCLGHPR